MRQPLVRLWPPLLAALLAIAAAATASAQSGDTGSLLGNGDFETDRDGDRWPDGWPHPTGASWQAEDGNRFVRLTSPAEGESVTLHRALPLPSSGRVLALHVSFRVRHSDIQPGREAWHDGRVVIDLLDAGGRKLQPAPQHPSYRGTSDGWIDHAQRIEVPPQAASLEIMPSLFEVRGGSLDIDEVKVMVTARASGPPPELRVVGNQIVRARAEGAGAGETEEVWLQGVNVASLEWAPAGEHVLRSIGLAIDDWNANVIRLPVSDAFWFGKHESQSDGGQAYRDLVDQAIDEASRRGAYTILDLHRFKAPTDEHVAFWADAAQRYRESPAVLFGLFNEPHSISWEIWRDGGTVEERAQREGVVAENQQQIATFQSPGMQALIDAVRGAQARNIVVVAGLDWGYDLSGIVSGFALDDRGGNGIIYDSHIYPWKNDWAGKVLPAAQKHPVLIGEVGATLKPMGFLPPGAHEDPYTWSPDMLGFIQQHRLHWTAWCFHPGAAPRMLQGWDYTPTPYWGAFARAALRGGQFRMSRMR